MAGVPIFNGFWSKEFILETGLKQGPVWAFGIMLFGAGLTAFYTIRMTWLVFYGQPRTDLHVHPAGRAMKIATGLLAVGTLTTWLLAGPLSGLLAGSLPFHALEPLSTQNLVLDVLTGSGTWFALLILVVGAGLWVLMQRSARPIPVAGWFEKLVSSSFGFEWLNRQVVSGVKKSGVVLQKTQTGELNWNILGILAALLAVLVLLFWGV